MNHLPTGFAEAWIAEDTSALLVNKCNPKQFKAARNIAAKMYALGQAHKAKQLRVDRAPDPEHLRRVANALVTMAADLEAKRARVLHGGVEVFIEAGNFRFTADMFIGGCDE